MQMGGQSQQRIAPTYLIHCYNKKRTMYDYFENMFALKGLTRQQVAVESLRLASQMDNLLFDDKVDVVSSLGVERICRRLWGVELALENVTSSNNMSKADWTLSDELDLNVIEGGGYTNTASLEEIKKRLERKALVKKWVSKSNESPNKD